MTENKNRKPRVDCCKHGYPGGYCKKCLEEMNAHGK